MSSIYELDGRVPLRQALPFGLQHILAMFVANITPIIILASAVGIDKGISATLIQNCMIFASTSYQPPRPSAIRRPFVRGH